MSSRASRSSNDDRSVSSGTSGDETGSKADQSTSQATSMSGQELLEEEKELMFQAESKQVVKLKRLVMVIMLLAAVGITTCIFMVMSKNNQNIFTTTYEDVALKLLSTFTSIASDKLAALGSFSASVSTHVLDRGEVWPFQSITYVNERMLTIRSLSGALSLTISPFIEGPLRKQWEEFSFADEETHWYAKGLEYEAKFGGTYDLALQPDDRVTLDRNLTMDGRADHIFKLDESGRAIIDPSNGPFLPSWQMSPVVKRTMVNRNLFTDPAAAVPANLSFSTATVVLGQMEYGEGQGDKDYYTALLTISKKLKHPFLYETSPLTRIWLPIYDTFDDETKKPVALVSALIRWESYFVNIIPAKLHGINLVLDNTCGDTFTFQITGSEPDPVGRGDLHEEKYSNMGRTATFEDVDSIEDGHPSGIPMNHDHCPYRMTLYPSQAMMDEFQTNLPALVTLAVALVFLFTFCMFLAYDKLVERRQNLVLQRAEQTTAIVQSLFPKNVADKLIQNSADNDILASKNQKLNKFLEGDEQGRSCIADLFPACTVLFADISGFTAWSSTRDPSQVFQLLEAIYNAFDEIAKARKVFKVETIGDCYVAVTGLPDPQANHAVIMARFASECMIKMKEVTQRLETTLGPDTAELCMRVGMHSGPVTAGVLRGDKSRFQLFGDTVNTASRMESTGTREKIQVSQEAANMLTIAGKGHWLTPRDDTINAKGKGVLQTYWLRTQSKKKAGSVTSSGGTHSSDNDAMLDASIPLSAEGEAILKRDRKVDWMTELIGEYLKQVIAKRDSNPTAKSSSFQLNEELIGIDEVVESISLPCFDAGAGAKESLREPNVAPIVMEQLREYVSIIASMYRNNPFHNFEHACHVTMSISKHLKRIAAPDLDINDAEKKACSKSKGAAMALIHDYTHGINSDPITHIALVFSGMIHDVDHRGISNLQLQKEEPALAEHFKHQSLAEQNSLEIAWTLLMSEQFAALRQSLFANKDDALRFRQIMVNAVMATDIFDPQLSALRKSRWEKAFSANVSCDGHDKNALRATIVLEHIIQASDVSHTMQHWHIYRKWNRSLFHELMLAHKAGRMAADPASFWFKGELGFFDNYVIPLAMKLKDCKVFGVGSDECLNYAMRNRAEWEVRGEEAVAEMVREFTDLGQSSEECYFA